MEGALLSPQGLQWLWGISYSTLTWCHEKGKLYIWVGRFEWLFFILLVQTADKILYWILYSLSDTALVVKVLWDELKRIHREAIQMMRNHLYWNEKTWLMGEDWKRTRDFKPTTEKKSCGGVMGLEAQQRRQCWIALSACCRFNTCPGQSKDAVFSIPSTWHLA